MDRKTARLQDCKTAKPQDYKTARPIQDSFLAAISDFTVYGEIK